MNEQLNGARAAGTGRALRIRVVLGLLLGPAIATVLLSTTRADVNPPPVFYHPTLTPPAHMRPGQVVDLDYLLQVAERCKETHDLMITCATKGRAEYRGTDSVLIRLGPGESFRTTIPIYLPPDDTSLVIVRAKWPPGQSPVALSCLFFAVHDDTVEVWRDDPRRHKPKKPLPAWARDTTKYDAIMTMTDTRYQEWSRYRSQAWWDRVSPTDERCTYKLRVTQDELRKLRYDRCFIWFVDDTLNFIIDTSLPPEYRMPRYPLQWLEPIDSASRPMSE